MPLVHASIAPHSPILMPFMRPDLDDKFAATVAAMEEIEGELYVMQPDTIFIISAHAPAAQEAFSVNLSPSFTSNFQEFGDSDISLNFSGDSELVSRIRELSDVDNSKTPNVPVNVVYEPVLDYGAAVTLYYLTQHITSATLVPISVSGLSLEQHFEFGKLLRSVAGKSNKRVAIVASAELSHTLSKDTQYGYHPDGQTFDAKVQQMITTKTLSDITQLNGSLIESAQALNGSRTLAILFGAMSDMGFDATISSYDSPMGVGLLVSHFNLV